MNQVLHIFRKDLRHHWKVCAIYLLLLVGYGYNEVRNWSSQLGLAAYAGGSMAGILIGRYILRSLVVLIPIVWAVLVSSAVHDESLVGDRQFWVTRPYDWKKLLAAKMLFVLAVVNLPLLILDFVLLAKAGFHPTSYLVGLLWMQLLLVSLPLLQLAAMASITSRLSQMLLVVLLVLGYVLGVAALSDRIPNTQFSVGADTLQFLFVLAASIAIVLLQYSRRRTGVSRWVVACLAAVIVVIVVLTPYRSLIEREYPVLPSTQAPPMQLAPMPVGSSSSVSFVREQADDEEVRIPLIVSGLAPGSMVNMNGFQISMEAPNGLRWNSDWRHGGMLLYPEQKQASLSFTVKRTFLDQVGDSPVDTRITLAFTAFRDQNQRTLTIPQGEFSIPGAGWCSASGFNESFIVCRAPLVTSRSLLLTYDLSQSTCPPPEGASTPAPGDLARAWDSYGTTFGPAEAGISPIAMLTLLPTPTNSVPERLAAGTCPGTPVVLSEPEQQYSARTELEFKQVPLASYRLNPARFGVVVPARR